MSGRGNSSDWRAWLKYAQEDRDFAEGRMDEPGNARHVALCAHQMMEHALKAVRVFHEGGLPERTHDLPMLAASLAEKGFFEFSEEEMDFLQELHSCFIPLKYPRSEAALPSHRKAKELFAAAAGLLERVRKETQYE